MSRKIKVRVWSKPLKRFHTKDEWFFDFDGNLYFWDIIENDLIRAREVEYVVQQYTGLKDKNGKEIFEGDVLKIRNHNQLQQVVFQDGCFGVGLENVIDGSEFIPITNEYYPHDLEIVGNIFENTEQLK